VTNAFLCHFEPILCGSTSLFWFIYHLLLNTIPKMSRHLMKKEDYWSTYHVTIKHDRLALAWQ